MPEIPRDPRQLARDILAGKISIEEIARQRQARTGGGGQPAPRPAAPQPAATPQRIPKPVILPPVQRQQAPQQRPRPVQPQPQRQPQQQTQRPRPQASQQTRLQPQAAVQVRQTTPVLHTPAVTAPPAPLLVRYNSPALNIRGLTRNRETLRQAMIMAEILAKPIGLRDFD